MKKIKIIGLIIGILGFLLEGASSYVEDKKMETMIEDEVRKQLAENNEEDES